MALIFSIISCYWRYNGSGSMTYLLQNIIFKSKMMKNF